MVMVAVADVGGGGGGRGEERGVEWRQKVYP